MYEESINEQLFVERFDDSFEEVFEDVRYNYNLFRKRNMEPGPAAGRTLYELDEDIQEYPELLLVAYITLTALICKDANKTQSLINHQIELINSILKANERLIITTFNNLNDDNKKIFSEMLTHIKENAYSCGEFGDVQKLILFT